MTYEQTIDYLYQAAPMFQQIGTAAYKESMENSFLIDGHLNHPHRKYKTIHVAGTNGKGSTSHLLASILQEAGYKVGLYTSPHLLDFRERIKINGEMIDQQFVIDFIAEHKRFFESIQPSFFELTTGMAFAYFAEKQIDIAVVEVGLGGRLDCTNIITPVLSIITNISFDHTNLLGNTLAAIAREKAGIIKQGVPVVIGEAEGDVREVFENIKDFKDFKDLKIFKDWMVFAEDEKPVLAAKLLPAGHWQLETKNYPALIDELGGYAQEKNAATVLCAIQILKNLPFSIFNFQFSIPDDAVCKGFRRVIENTGLMGRWQIIQNHPKIVLDTGHNTGGIGYIVRQLEAENWEKLHIVFGMVNDKDISGVLALLPENALYYFTNASIPRALKADLLAGQAQKFGLQGAVFPTVEAAFSSAKQNATEKDFIFVGGSTFVVAEALRIEN
ncbi:MAG: bifunctional folylpolyglutamate synthase/dihydrofolate synthase [Dysgonamonadaceae bacterium]|jgi:dihydrofolate synthase/folylpolyglutamate synthase|nr:bifunctional folylpolyglutamate synthase/dihydrofolate synthase [Dysgonamonadaceae bacterium]